MCKKIKALGKEWHKVTKYLVEHKRWQPSNLKKYDNSGTLSHLQLLLMVDYNKELIAKGMKLPIVPRVKRQPIAETDAERQAEFSQDIQSGHLKSREIEETKLSSIHRETRDHRQSAEGGQPTPRSHSSSSDRWRRTRHKSRECSRSKGDTLGDHDRKMFTVPDRRRVVEWTGSRRRAIDSRARDERNAWSNPVVRTRL